MTFLGVKMVTDLFCGVRADTSDHFFGGVKEGQNGHSFVLIGNAPQSQNGHPYRPLSLKTQERPFVTILPRPQTGHSYRTLCLKNKGMTILSPPKGQMVNPLRFSCGPSCYAQPPDSFSSITNDNNNNNKQIHICIYICT